jgi:hypothetical protein
MSQARQPATLSARQAHLSTRAKIVVGKTVVAAGGLSETVQSPTGQTAVLVQPLVVRTGGYLGLRIHSRGLAHAVATVAYPDGQTVQQEGWLGPRGWLLLAIHVLYQPLDRSALATVNITVTKGAVFSETVTATFTVVRQAILAQSFLVVRPTVVHTGQTLAVLVHSLPYVQVHISVTDPSGQAVSTDGATDPTGVFSTTVPISYNPRGQASATIVVTALLTYEGQTRLLGWRVPLLKP